MEVYSHYARKYPLHNACEAKDLDAVKILIQDDIEKQVNSKDNVSNNCYQYSKLGW